MTVADQVSGYTETPANVWRVPVAGGSVVAIVMNQNNPQGITLDGTSLYWADNGGAMEFPQGATGAIMKLTPR